MYIKKAFLLYLGILFCASISCAQTTRTKVTVNDAWRFLNDGIAFGQNNELVDDSTWEMINVPHTWNAVDPFDAVKSYKRGTAWYRKAIEIDPSSRESSLFYLHFEGVNQIADVYVNNIHVGRHKGGYTAFTLNITNALSQGKKQFIAIKVDNSHDPFIAPLSVGFALYGGIYRDIWLVSTNKVHFDMDNYGSNGVFIKTPTVNNESATTTIQGTLVNDDLKDKSVSVVSTIYDRNNIEIGNSTSQIDILAQGQNEFTQDITILNPKLWSPNSPYLYHIKTKIIANGMTMDELENPLGLRWFSFDAGEGFSLNGKPLKLRGTNRHQDKMGKGSALTNAEHRRDMELIKEMGANFIRIAHYPQDPEILKAADELGLLAWEEIPLVNYMTIHPEFLNNSKTMLKEMIRQHYNHPSIVVWGSMNEIFLWGNNEQRISKQNDPDYTNKVSEYAKILDQTIREEDPSRFTTLAMHQSSDYDMVGIEDIPQISSYNVYSGWYGGKFADFGGWMDNKHKTKPDQVMFISEYGAGSDASLNSDRPERFDFTGQYQRLFSESYIEQIEERDFVSGSAIWNQNDFSQPHVGGSMPHLNQKGVMTWDRKPKDVYYLFQANWSNKPMVHIAEKDWPVRAVTTNSKNYTITVYSNQTEVILYVNGKKIGRKLVNDLHKTQFEVTLKAGINNIKAVSSEKGKTIEDQTSILLQQYLTIEKPNVFINLGSNAQYFYKASQTSYLEDQPFDKNYGYSGGKEVQLDRKHILRSGLHDGLFYTALEDPDSYRVKVENGIYKLTLYFMEIENVEIGHRIFDVSINGVNVVKDLDIMKEVGFCYGYSKTFSIEVKDNQVLLEFTSSNGKSIISGLELTK